MKHVIPIALVAAAGAGSAAVGVPLELLAKASPFGLFFAVTWVAWREIKAVAPRVWDAFVAFDRERRGEMRESELLRHQALDRFGSVLEAHTLEVTKAASQTQQEVIANRQTIREIAAVAEYLKSHAPIGG